MKTLTLAAVLLVGCGASPKHGGDSGSTPDDQPSSPAELPSEEKTADSPVDKAKIEHRSMLVADASALPACTLEAKGWLIYVQSEQKFKVCEPLTWVDVEIKGEKGEKGDAGAAGKDGTDNRIIKSISCGGEIGTTGLWAHYSVSIMTSGDVFASASIKNNLDQSSGASFYSSKQNGANNASVLITKDEAGNATMGFWNVTLNRQTLVTTLSYFDAEFNPAEEVFTMTPDKCTVNDY